MTDHLSRRDLSGSVDRAAFALAAGVVAIRPLYAFDARQVTPSLVLAVVAGTGVLLWLAGQAVAGSLEVRWPRVCVPLLVLAVVVVAAVFTASHRRPAIAQGSEWVATLLAVLCLVQTVRSRTRAWVLLAMLLATAAVVTLYGVYQYAFGLAEVRAAYQRDPQGVLARLGHIEYGSWMQARFEKRLANQEAFSTFAVSNSLAGYCLMLLPVAVGLVGDALVGRRRYGLGVAVLMAVGASAVAGLVLTKSLGGYVVGLAAAGALVLGAAWPRVRRHARVAVPAGAATVAVVVGVLAWRVNAVGVERTLGPSIRFRLDYWTGALRIIGRYPLRGVGLEGFGDYYPRYKPPESPEDVRRPHNLVLGLWAEMGLAVVLVGAWLGVVLAAPGGSPVDAPPQALPAPPVSSGHAPRRRRLPPRPHPPLLARRLVGDWTVPLVVVAPMWLAVYVVGLQGETFCVVGGVVWAVAAMLLVADERAALLGRLTRVGLGAGAVGLVLHAMIDLDAGVPALMATLLGLLTVRLGLRQPHRMPRALPRWAAVALLAGGGAVVVWFVYGLALPLAAGEGDYLAARAERLAADEAARAGRGAAWDTRRRNAQRLYRRSLQRDPLNAEAHADLARMAFEKWRALRSGPTTAGDAWETFRLGLADLHAALRIYPRSVRFQRLAAEVEFDAAKTVGSRDERLAHLARAHEAADRLVNDLYPSNVRHLLLRADILEALGEEAAAAADLRAALRYDDLQRDALLRLSDAERRRAEDALQRLTP